MGTAQEIVMTQEQKQKIMKDFYKYFEEESQHLEQRYLTPDTHSIIKDYWFSILDKAIKDKLEAVEWAVKEVSLGEIPNYEERGSHFGYDEDVLAIINKHK